MAIWTREELSDLLFAGILLSVVFVISYQWSLWLAFIVVAIGLIIHELGHKFVGVFLGMDEIHFMLSPLGIAAGFLSGALIGQALVTPGGVTYDMRENSRDRFLMGLGGPAANMLLFGVFMLISMTAPFTVGVADGEVNVWLAAALVNLYLALFNLLPIPMFDGHQLYKINPMWWAVSLVSVAGTVAYFWGDMQRELSVLFTSGWSGIVGWAMGQSWGIWLLPLVPSLIIARHLEIGVSDVIGRVGDSDYIKI